MARGQDSRHDVSRQPVIPAEILLRRFQGGDTFRGRVYPSGSVPTDVKMERALEQQRAIRESAAGMPEHSEWYDQFSDPKRAVREMEANVALGTFLTGLAQHDDAGGNPGEAEGLVDRGMPMPSAGHAVVSGDTVVRFDPSILLDQSPKAVKKAEREFNKKKAK